MSLKLHHRYSLKKHFPCWGMYLLSHEQEMLKCFSRRVDVARHCKTFVVWISCISESPHCQGGLGSSDGVRGPPCSASQKVGWLLCRTDCFKGSNEVSQARLCKSFPCKSRLISSTNQGEWEPLLLVAVRGFALTRQDPAGEDPSHPTCQAWATDFLGKPWPSVLHCCLILKERRLLPFVSD